MARFFYRTIFLLPFFSFSLLAQPGIKRKKLDTTVSILLKDSTLTKLVEFKDSIVKVGPKAEDLREPAASDSDGLTLLIIGSVLLIVWAGRRAWMRRREK